MTEPERHDGAWLRKQRLQTIRQHVTLELAKGEVTVESLVAWIQVEIGLSKRSAKEYLGIVVASEGLQVSQESKIRKEVKS